MPQFACILPAMARMKGIAGIASILIWLVGSSVVGADEIRVAVASNFANTMREISGRFEEQTGHEVILAFASTGKHYAQIKNGAPFDAFFGADTERPERLEKEGLAVAGSRFTYALGTLVLWSPEIGMVDAAGKVLELGGFRFLSLANPKLAPYGRAAQEVLKGRALWQSLQPRMVRGENIGQAFQFVISGNAELGFVARSQIDKPGEAIAGSWWEIPVDLYSPIAQQAVLLSESTAARELLAFVRGQEALDILRSYGYRTP